MQSPSYPIFDLHCDLLSYLDAVPGSTIHDRDAIGCALPHLRAGGLRLQVMAVFAPTEAGSTASAERQIQAFASWDKPGSEFRRLQFPIQPSEILSGDSIYTLYAIENASCLAEEDAPLETAFARLEAFSRAVGLPLYISLTHHAENRFGGGNFTDIGLKEDGKALLGFLSRSGIALDFSHTCDRLAREMLDHIDALGLEIPILASHSNFRPVCGHVRNLPDWLTHEITRRGGIIGLNFVRDFVDPFEPETLIAHVRYGQQQGARLAWSADYFSPAIMPPSAAFREPYFHPEHRDASCYPAVMASLQAQGIPLLQEQAWKNAWEWISAVRG